MHVEFDVEYPNESQKAHSDLPFLPERMNFSKLQKLMCNLHEKKTYVMHIKALKRALGYGLINSRKVQRVIECNQEA